MANIPSVIKRNRQAQKRRVRNQAARTKVRGAVKGVRDAVTAGGSAADRQKALGQAMRTLQKAASKGLLHKRTAARKISRLSKSLNRAP
jgi:small subunit ribosomal protein S20